MGVRMVMAVRVIVLMIVTMIAGAAIIGGLHRCFRFCLAAILGDGSVLDFRVGMVLGGLADVVEHIDQHVADMLVGRRIERLFALAGFAQDARGAQQAKMVAHQGWRGPDLYGDIADGTRLADAGDKNLQARRIAHQPEDLRELEDVAICVTIGA